MSTRKILILNGVNLNMLGSREIDIYGEDNFQSYFTSLAEKYPTVHLEYRQSNKVDVLVELIQESRDFNGIIINPGAYTHTSIVIADAIKTTPVPCVEVHITNIYNREEYRKKSFISACCKGSIFGFGLKGYELALLSFLI